MCTHPLAHGYDPCLPSYPPHACASCASPHYHHLHAPSWTPNKKSHDGFLLRAHRRSCWDWWMQIGNQAIHQADQSVPLLPLLQFCFYSAFSFVHRTISVRWVERQQLPLSPIELQVLDHLKLPLAWCQEFDFSQKQKNGMKTLWAQSLKLERNAVENFGGVAEALEKQGRKMHGQNSQKNSLAVLLKFARPKKSSTQVRSTEPRDQNNAVNPQTTTELILERACPIIPTGNTSF